MENQNKYKELDEFFKSYGGANEIADVLEFIREEYIEIVLNNTFSEGEIALHTFHNDTPDHIFYLKELVKIFNNIHTAKKS